MPTNPQQVGAKVDHAEEARGVLQWVVGGKGPDVLDQDPRVVAALQLAQVYASLATVEALQGIWHQLEELNVRLDRG